MLSFTTAWSVLDLPCLTLPVSSVRPDDIITADREPLCAVDAEMQAECTFRYLS